MSKNPRKLGDKGRRARGRAVRDRRRARAEREDARLRDLFRPLRVFRLK